MKKSPEDFCVVISTTATRVTFGITGAAVGMPALTNGLCTAEVPLSHVMGWLGEKFDDGAVVTFEIAPGSMRVGNITTTSPQIVLQTFSAMAPSVSLSAPDVQPITGNPLDAGIDAPLFAAYAYLKRYGQNLATASKTFAGQQIEVDEILYRADRLLRPLGLGRRDIERILDRRIEGSSET